MEEVIFLMDGTRVFEEQRTEGKTKGGRSLQSEGEVYRGIFGSFKPQKRLHPILGEVGGSWLS